MSESAGDGAGGGGRGGEGAGGGACRDPVAAPAPAPAPALPLLDRRSESVAIEELIRRESQKCVTDLKTVLQRTKTSTDAEKKEALMSSIAECKQRIIGILINVEWSKKHVRRSENFNQNYHTYTLL